MIPYTLIDFFDTLPEYLDTLYYQMEVIGDEADNLMNSVADDLSPVEPADLQTIAQVMDDMKNKLENLETLANKIHNTLTDEEEK